MSESKYSEAGVDLEAGKRATDLMKSAVQATYTSEVLAGLGSFGGLFSGLDPSALRTQQKGHGLSAWKGQATSNQSCVMTNSPSTPER